MANSDLVFYYFPKTRARTVLWMLEELGAPYDMKVLDLPGGEHKRAEYLAINPMGKVPAITHMGVAVTETAAICCYLADAFPAAGLAPKADDPRRGTYLRWIFYAAGCIEPAILDKALQREPGKAVMTGYGTFDDMVDAVAGALSQGEYVLGGQFSAADVVLGAMVEYGVSFGVLPSRSEFAAYIARLNARPAKQRAVARDAEMAAQLSL